jgi:3-methyladenine DNA glycosylase/8-oxoguanine DNA glycosylase
MPEPTAGLVQERVVDVGASLGWYRVGAGDPTTRISVVGRGGTSCGQFVRATITPDGPGTIHLAWGAPPPAAAVDGVPVAGLPGLHARAYGPGASWLLARAASMAGADDPGEPALEAAPHRAVATAARAHRALRWGASGDLYHELLPAILGQRITVREAYAQWRRLCRTISTPAPGPFDGLLLPPAPAVLSRQPSWSLHRLGIERKRAEPMIELAKHPAKLWSWARLPPVSAAAMLRHLPGIGPWTIGTALGPALGDPDAVPVGDYHVKHMVAWALAGEARATDERMLELLEPYRGSRGRVVRLLKMGGNRPPAYGPKQRIVPMHDR